MTLQEIFQVQENYKLPDAIMEALLSKEAEKYIRAYADNEIDTNSAVKVLLINGVKIKVKKEEE